MTRILITIPFAILFVLGACKKPVLEVPLTFVPPLVLSTSIHDSLPSAAIDTLKLEGLSGLKIKHHNGLYASYFEYEADKDLLLRTIAGLPFRMDATRADTRCHFISVEEFETVRQNLQPQEFENTTFFWNTDQSKINVFECIKPPYKHILLIESGSNHILHRIELQEHS